MLFSSAVFLFQFLPMVLLLFFLLKKYRSRLWLLMLSSILFYGYWNVNYLGLLFFSIIIDYWVGRWMDGENSSKKKKLLLILSVSVNLGVLFVFKYFNFFVDSVQSLGGQFGFYWFSGVQSDLILPVGISFYTFQSMSYTIDIYRKHTKAHKDFLAFFTYVSFFPQLIAGPIIRYSDLLPQLESKNKLEAFDPKYIQQGIFFFVVGLSKKILIADRIGASIDPILGDIGTSTSLEAWLCMFGYSFQLYFDFSGYSDMAVGIGKFFHLDFPKNFNSPYKSKSITEFWKRWHISLSSWLRDYLYISLGGNRKGPSRTYLNLIITMLLGGLWHGAGWTFVVWGAMHGLALAFERKWKSLNLDLSFPGSLRLFMTYFYVCIAWVVFRASSLSHAKLWFYKMFEFGPLSLETPNIPGRYEAHLGLALVFAVGISFRSRNTFEKYKTLSNGNAYLMAILFVLSLMFLRAESPFLYFQF